MKHRIVAGFAIALFALSQGFGVAAQAGECSSQIAELQHALEKQPDLVGTAPQTIGAQLGKQPTPSSVAQAEAHSKGDVARMLEQAKALDGQGKEGECMAAVAKARLILNP
jgi:hypothetical protein